MTREALVTKLEWDCWVAFSFANHQKDWHEAPRSDIALHVISRRQSVAKGFRPGLHPSDAESEDHSEPVLGAMKIAISSDL